MSKINCLTKDSLYLFLNGKTSTEQMTRIELHLADCANCRLELSAIFSESVRETQNFKAPEYLIKRVKELHEKEIKKSVQESSSNPWYRQGYSQIAFATVLLCFVGISFLLFYFSENTNTYFLRHF